MGVFYCFLMACCQYMSCPLVHSLTLPCSLRQAKDVVKTIKKRIGHKNSKVQLLALTVNTILQLPCYLSFTSVAVWSLTEEPCDGFLNVLI